MPYVLRDQSGRIVALSEIALTGAEDLDVGHPEIQAFLDRISNPDAAESDRFVASDLQLIRVIEDVIESLILKGVLAFTDLPAPAQSKLMERRALRGWLNDVLGGFDADSGNIF